MIQTNLLALQVFDGLAEGVHLAPRSQHLKQQHAHIRQTVLPIALGQDRAAATTSLVDQGGEVPFQLRFVVLKVVQGARVISRVD